MLISNFFSSAVLVENRDYVVAVVVIEQDDPAPILMQYLVKFGNVATRTRGPHSTERWRKKTRVAFAFITIRSCADYAVEL